MCDLDYEKDNASIPEEAPGQRGIFTEEDYVDPEWGDLRKEGTRQHV